MTVVLIILIFGIGCVAAVFFYLSRGSVENGGGEHMGGNVIIRAMYTVFLGILLAAFVGFGIAAFYAQPAAPEMPAALKVQSADKLSVDAYKLFIAEQSQYDKAEKDYSASLEVYNRNVSVIAIILAVALLAVSLLFFQRIALLADGTLLGGVLTLLYGIGRGFGSGSDMYRFATVSVGLLVALGLGYIKFLRPRV